MQYWDVAAFEMTCTYKVYRNFFCIQVALTLFEVVVSYRHVDFSLLAENFAFGAACALSFAKLVAFNGIFAMQLNGRIESGPLNTCSDYEGILSDFALI